ncbi:D-alanyl-D-alanine carboxypeptidase [Sporosarcina sp. PTS2304]|uniref:D-alanyl-D-alanine carboxypeptidase family protein n=1 Tax=Sporosarcina sp. PTS2304 TaxID=2283194 RepID=UPI000E0D2769|nr:D-alanyl-D-alanine carboxypeptidase family protein [Sporosarcina sp. PTS2304]AXH99244.1 D-alanyl-D-alanine carboxypeptidase [Sporosarcina sp. PTS2304]
MKKLVVTLLLCVGIYLWVTKWNDFTMQQEDWSISAKAMLLVNADTGEVLYEENSEKPLPIASMTKLMTQYIVLNTINNGSLSWDTVYKPSPTVVHLTQFASASKLGMKANESYTVRELFIAMTVISANDAALALAEIVAGSEEEFVAIMNEQARAFKLKHTTFYNPHGLDGSYLGRSENHNNVASASDMAIIADRLIKKHPVVLEYTSMPSFTSRQGMTMWNTDLLLPGMRLQMAGMDGLKTGYTDAAGPCFTGTGVFNGERLISVLIGVDEVDGDLKDPKFVLTREMIGRFTE